MASHQAIRYDRDGNHYLAFLQLAAVVSCTRSSRHEAACRPPRKTRSKSKSPRRPRWRHDQRPVPTLGQSLGQPPEPGRGLDAAMHSTTSLTVGPRGWR